MTIDAVLFGAFERHNFGDLLMGHIFEDLLGKKGLRTIHASILENDLTSCSGRVVHSLFELAKAGLDPNTPILHVGGETASCTFQDALPCDIPLSLPHEFKDDVCKEAHSLLRTTRSFPYISPPSESIGGTTFHWRNRLFYGLGFTQTEACDHLSHQLKESLSESRFIGFRDGHSLANAKGLGLENARFTPDIALYLSRLISFPKEPAVAGYLMLHFNREFLRKNRDMLINELSRLSRSFEGGIKIGLAGTANYHDSLDDLYSFQASALQASVSIEVLPSTDILSICRQIAQASIVISTSLHYRIVARSYGVPRLTMNAHKVNCWSQTNDDAYPYGVEPHELAATVTSLAQGSWPCGECTLTQELDYIDGHIETISDMIHNAKCASNSTVVKAAIKQPMSPSPDLWITSMVRCLENRDSAIRRQRAIIGQQEQILLSKRRLIQRLLGLLLPRFVRNRLVQHEGAKIDG